MSDGEVRTFRLAGNAGCSSLDSMTQPRRGGRNQSSVSQEGYTFGRVACGNKIVEERQVVVVTLQRLLSWVGSHRRIELIKVDAQGTDIDVIASGGLSLRQVERFVLETRGDECAPLYASQKSCSEVVAASRALGYEPASPLSCRLHASEMTTATA